MGQGVTFAEVCKMTVEGSIIRGMRRRRLLRQMCQVRRSPAVAAVPPPPLFAHPWRCTGGETIGNTDLENKFAEASRASSATLSSPRACTVTCMSSTLARALP